MFHTVDEFLQAWEFEAAATQKILNQLTDESLHQEVTPQNWTLGRIAWHVVTAIGNITSKAGLSLDVPAEDYPVPSSASFISNSYWKASSAMEEAVKNQWTDESLEETQDFYGQKITKSTLLLILVQHQVHHRGQMTVLMRQAGLAVPGLYGPAKEEWESIGMEAPRM
ncbi:DinB family protein [Domibacillus indicus]|uniref:DinB family protein n=1 Tax=Domibacillus indicus TaxID=1437523 RepID=UPI00061801F8|nr:DinB family protein [Domibacillus indicus]